MARAGDTVTLTYRADIRDLTKKLSSIEGLTAAEARKTVKALSKELKKAAAATAPATDGAKKYGTALVGVGKSSAGASVGVQALAQQLPDVLSQMQTGTPIFTIFSQQGLQVAQQMGLAQKAMAGVGAAAGPLAIAIAAVTTVAVVVANSIDEARDSTRLWREEMDRADASAQSLTTSSQALKSGTADVAGFIGELQLKTALLNGEIQQADVVAGELGGKLADELNPKLRSAGRAVGENENRIQKLNAALRSGKLGTEAYATAQAQLTEAKSIQPGLEENLAGLKEEYAQGRLAINAYTTALQNKADADSDTKDATADVTLGARLAAEAQRDLTTAIEAQRTAEIDVMADREALIAGYDEQIAAMDAIIAKYGESSVQAQASASAILAIEEAKANSLIEFDKKVADAAIKEGERVDREEKAREDERDREKAQKDALELRQFEADQQAKFAIAAIATDALVDLSGILLDAKIANIDTETKAGREQAMKFAKAQKAIAVSGAIANTALGLVKSVATLGPPVPPNWEGMAGFASAAAIGTTAIAGAAATPLPEFPTGGVVPETSMDHRAVGIQGGEAVLNRAAVDRLGAEGVNEINRGGGGTQVVAVNMYEHRVFDAFIADNLRRNGPLRRAIRDAGKSNGPRVRT